MPSLSSYAGRKRIEKEDDLVNHRMTWCVGSNSFLLAAFALSNNNTNDSLVSKNLAYLLPIAGMMMSVSFIISIIAAWYAIWHWREAVDKNQDYLFSPIRIAFCGSVASISVPALLLFLWVMVLFSQYANAEGIEESKIQQPHSEGQQQNQPGMNGKYSINFEIENKGEAYKIIISADEKKSLEVFKILWSNNNVSANLSNVRFQIILLIMIVIGTVATWAIIFLYKEVKHLQSKIQSINQQNVQ